ncbi:FecR family protein [Sphingobacterium nematocida]|uniref:FecR family protein n=1 Tax=Sphingobacterium nematocida TaxID=1513896 RepID=A0A1T5F4T6_9SPHI|nr:FecR family protein [Sphingobacterium nematocida]SKB91212.1 FecR family protein [Sphingobacterium nematocida]
MDRKDFLILLRKYRKGKASKQEVDFLMAYYQLFESQEDIFVQMEAEEKDTLGSDIKVKVDELIRQKEKKRDLKQRPLWHRLPFVALLAAIFICVVLFAYWRYVPEKNDKVELLHANTETIRPGRDEAILTLADGTQLILNDEMNGFISRQSGAVVEKTPEGELIYHVKGNGKVVENTIETPRGGQYRLVLSDGTKVWLNAASSIRFPTVFAGNTRQVEISGEVYFEVKRDSSRPFKVLSENQMIEVLGTNFNVNTYKDETSNKTTLLEGSIRITKLDKDKRPMADISKVLHPGQQALLSPVNNHIVVENSPNEDAVAWKDGYFKFNRDDLQTIMRQVARWYDVEVEYQGELSKDQFVGEIKRGENIEEVLRILKLNRINVNIIGRKVIIYN